MIRSKCLEKTHNDDTEVYFELESHSSLVLCRVQMKSLVSCFPYPVIMQLEVTTL